MLIAVLCIFCTAVFADNLNVVRVNHIDFDELPLVEINDGYYGDIEMLPKLEDIGRGLAPIHFYSLPDYDQPGEVILTTIVDDKKVFYPIVILLNENYEPVRVVDDPVSLHRVNQYEISGSIKIAIEPRHKYMVITTDPSLYGDHLKYKRLTTSMVRMYNGERYRYVPVTTGTHEVNVEIADSGRIAISVPRASY